MLITDVGSGVRKMNHMVFLNEKDVCSLLTPADAIAAAEETFLHIGLGISRWAIWRLCMWMKGK